MVALQPLVSAFTLVGKLEDLAIKPNGRVKYLLLADEQQQYWIKLPKDQPVNLNLQLQPGCSLKVTGMQTHKIHKGKVEYKAYGIEVLETPVVKQSKNKTAAKVLFCQESTCWHKGGKAACELLQAELQQRGIAEQVQIKTTGCLKRCKQAPNVVILPDRVNYSRVKPQQIPTLIEKYFINY